jgi:hypothetical protein
LKLVLLADAMMYSRHGVVRTVGGKSRRVFVAWVRTAVRRRNNVHDKRRQGQIKG